MSGGMRFVCFLICLSVSACNRPGPHFRDLAVTRISVDGSVFDVRVRNELAEAQRLNAEYAPRLGQIGLRAAKAMAQVSGCTVTQVRGDQAIATGLLDCGGKVPRRSHASQSTGEIECVRVDRWVTDANGIPYEEYDCDPI
jgi:hypothetical protein